MKKLVLITSILMILSSSTMAIKVKFIVANSSINVAQGTIGVFTAFQIYPSSFVNPNPSVEADLVDFPGIFYEDVVEIIIEKTLLSEDLPPSYSEIASFSSLPNSTINKYFDENFTQGSTYAYRLAVSTSNNKQHNLINKSKSTQIGFAKMNCAKFNNIYRLAGHNNYQESVIDPANGGFYETLFFTRVVELDVWSGNPNGIFDWEVRHTAFPGGCSGNCNNCKYLGQGPPATGPSAGDQPFGFCIDDIKNWHNFNVGHDPIILYIDLKSDWDYGKSQSPADLDQKLLTLVSNAQEIYKPQDLNGNAPVLNNVAAQKNNWPSMGDLEDKLIFVLTGDGSKIAQYLNDRGNNAVAFTAGNVTDVQDVVNAASDIVFFNINLDDINNGQGLFASANRYVNRVWDSNFLGFPLAFSNNEYSQSIDERINNIAVKDIDGNYNPSQSRPIDGILLPDRAERPLLNNSHIYSNYSNVTQAATEHIVATNLTVEPNAHYRMIANDFIDLQPGVDFLIGSDVDVRIDDCENADYNLRQANSGEQLTQEEIDALMHELNKELYGYILADENELIRLVIYPNPTHEIVNISYTNYLLNQAIFTLYDITGRVVESKKYTPSVEGKQSFSLSINELKEGTYFYTLQVGEQSYNGKVVKMSQ